MGKQRARTETGTKYSNSLIYQMTNAFPYAVCYSIHILYSGWPTPHYTTMNTTEYFSFDRTFLYLLPEVEMKYRQRRHLFKKNCNARLQCFEQPLKPPTLISILIKGVGFLLVRHKPVKPVERE